MSLTDSIKNYTKQLDEQGLLRRRKVYEPDLLHFDSNDYLSLTQDKQINEFYQTGYSQFPVGSGSSMILSGYHAQHQTLERTFATWLHTDECLLFPSGYAANLAIGALLEKIQAHCFIDKAVHASIYDGLNLAKVPFTRFLHNEVSDLQAKMHAAQASKVLMTEGIFSMSGQQAPLKSFAALKIECIVDEAHSIGLIGNEGKGAVDYHGLSQQQVPLRMLAFGKAFAAQGALVAGQSVWIDALAQAARSLIYTTAISPALTYGLLKTLDVVRAADDRRFKLQALIQHFNSLIPKSALCWTDSQTAIQQVQLGCPKRAVYYAEELKKRGISCAAIRAPTVSPKASGLRIILNYRHQAEDIELLFKALNEIYEHSSN
ncbi:MAG: aminotransferase class I/II-fold pyridoxal phosphate-dependent enzyme [Legionella sp.]|jgi:8-amino-7-oxononanoate synthase